METEPFPHLPIDKAHVPSPAWAAGACPDCSAPLTEKETETFCHCCAYEAERAVDPLLQTEDAALACWNGYVDAAERGDRESAEALRNEHARAVHDLRFLQAVPVAQAVQPSGSTRHRRASGSRPARRRGSRRATATRAGPDDDPHDLWPPSDRRGHRFIIDGSPR